MPRYENPTKGGPPQDREAAVVHEAFMQKQLADGVVVQMARTFVVPDNKQAIADRLKRGYTLLDEKAPRGKVLMTRVYYVDNTPRAIEDKERQGYELVEYEEVTVKKAVAKKKSSKKKAAARGPAKE